MFDKCLHFHLCLIVQCPVSGRGVARAKYVGWTDMASAERMEPTGESSPNLNRTDPRCPPPVKLVGFVSISGATSSKSGMDMSTPVHPVATPLQRQQLHRKVKVMVHGV